MRYLEISLWFVFMSCALVGCLLTVPGNLPAPDPTKPLYQRAGLFKKPVEWPKPKTEAELELLEQEIAIRAEAEATAKFRNLCHKANVIWLFGIALCAFLAIYLRSKAFGIAAAICLFMVPLTFTMSSRVPKAAPAIAGLIVAFIVALVAFSVWYLAKKYRTEGGALSEVVATMQRTKDRPWDNVARNLANRIQGKATQERVSEIKAKLPGVDHDA